MAALIEKHGLIDRVIISSFNPFALRRVKRANPRLACGLLYAPDLPIFLRDAWLAPLIPGLNARHPHHSQVNRAVVGQFHARGLAVNVWTVNQAGRRAGDGRGRSGRPHRGRSDLDSRNAGSCQQAYSICSP